MRGLIVLISCVAVFVMAVVVESVQQKFPIPLTPLGIAAAVGSCILCAHIGRGSKKRSLLVALLVVGIAFVDVHWVRLTDDACAYENICQPWWHYLSPSVLAFGVTVGFAVYGLGLAGFRSSRALMQMLSRNL